ncbi:MAG: hypothetical protein QF788_07860, partial [SAR324 cluster bacterium]|nr:hypothetical protein [SAR324 cluster bacterium]
MGYTVKKKFKFELVEKIIIKLDKTFNITPEVVEEETKVVKKEKPDRLTKDDITRDYEYTRGNLYSIIEKGQEAIDGI